MKKIALVSGDSSLTGVPFHVIQLARGLKRRRFEVEIIAPPGPFVKYCLKNRLKVKTVPMKGPFDRKAVDKIYEALTNFNPDISHFHGVRGGWLGRLAARNIRSTKKIYTEHLWTKYFHLPNAAYERFQLAGLKFLDRWTNHTIAVSGSVKDFLLSRGLDGQKISVVPNGISPSFLRLKPIVKPPGTPFVIGSVASLTFQKNYRNMILGFAKAKKQLPKANLHYQIIGEGPLEKPLKRLGAKAGIGKRVHFLGKVPSVEERLRHFSIFLGISTSESFGLAIGEAMATGVPVIASSIKPLRELVGKEAGVLVDPRQSDEIAQAIVKLFREGDTRRAMGAAGKRRIRENFSEQNMVEKTIAVYEKVLGEAEI